MSRFSTALNHLPNVARYLSVLAAIIFISLLCPNNAKFKYSFEKGMTWKYEDLKAPFDFPIKKPLADIEADALEFDKNFSPYYIYDNQIEKSTKERFKTAFEQQLKDAETGNQFEHVRSNAKLYYNYGLQYINRVYNRGIVRVDGLHKEKKNDFVINVLKGNTSSIQTISNLAKAERVNDWLLDTLMASKLKEGEFLIDPLTNIFVPNLVYNDSMTVQIRDMELESIPKTKGLVKANELIVENGQKVKEETYQKLISYRDKYTSNEGTVKSQFGIFAGYLMLTSLLMGVFLIYLQYNEPGIFNYFNRFVFILMLMVIYSYLVYMTEEAGLSAYFIPFCIGPIIIKSFYNDRLAIFTHIVIVLIASFLSSEGYEFTFLQILVGIVAVLTTVETRYLSKFFLSLGYILATLFFAYFGLSLIKDGSLLGIEWETFGLLFLNVLLTMLAFPLIPLVEKLFGFTSNITLVELSDLNNPLLKEMSIEAPGTLQHSLQVANLSEAAASKIGADALLIKVAALYHDIGKVAQPTYYIENQSARNPHEDLSNLDSAKIIIEHVTKGVEMAEKAKLPQVIVNFVRTHHGTTRTEYFYRNHIKDNPELEKDEPSFRYPGPKPKTKEESILMIADSIEAAGKSLKSPNEIDINNLVENIVNGKLAAGQLDDSELTYSEMQVCKTEFKKLLKSIYHVRIEYPDEKK